MNILRQIGLRLGAGLAGLGILGAVLACQASDPTTAISFAPATLATPDTKAVPQGPQTLQWQLLVQPPNAQGRTPLRLEWLKSLRIGALEIPVASIEATPASTLEPPDNQALTDSPPQAETPSAVKVQFLGNGKLLLHFQQPPPSGVVQLQLEGYAEPVAFPWVAPQAAAPLTLHISRTASGQSQVKGFYPQSTQAVRSFSVSPLAGQQHTLSWQQADGSTTTMDFNPFLQTATAPPAPDGLSDTLPGSGGWPASFDQNWNQSTPALPTETPTDPAADGSLASQWAEINQMFARLEGTPSSPDSPTSSATDPTGGPGITETASGFDQNFDTSLDQTFNPGPDAGAPSDTSSTSQSSSQSSSEND